MTDLPCSSCRLSLGQTLELSIDALSSDGRGIGKSQGFVVFAEGALPRQRVLVRVLSVKKRFAEARIEALLAPCADELSPQCAHAVECGGCPWQTLPYARQLFWKQRVVEDAFKRVGHLASPDVRPILPSPDLWGYRNKMSFAFGQAPNGQLTLGQRSRRSKHVIDLTDCKMQDEKTMTLLEVVRGFAKESGLRAKTGQDPSGFWKFLVSRRPRSGKFVVEVISARHPGGGKAARDLATALFQAIQAANLGVDGFTLALRSADSDVAQGEQTLFSAGDTKLHETLQRPAGLFPGASEHLALGFDTASFFQVNTPAAEKLYAEAASLLASVPFEELYDLYCGVGGIGLFLAPRAKSVYGVELVEAAVRMARANAARAGFAHCLFDTGDAARAFARMEKSDAGSRSAVLVDPPRAGLSVQVVDGLLNANVGSLLYVSCNPATLARDVARLSEKFRLVSAQPVDLFPQTPHVECVVLLVRK